MHNQNKTTGSGMWNDMQVRMDAGPGYSGPWRTKLLTNLLMNLTCCRGYLQSWTLKGWASSSSSILSGGGLGRGPEEIYVRETAMLSVRISLKFEYKTFSRPLTIPDFPFSQQSFWCSHARWSYLVPRETDQKTSLLPSEVCYSWLSDWWTGLIGHIEIDSTLLFNRVFMTLRKWRQTLSLITKYWQSITSFSTITENFMFSALADQFTVV